MTYHDLLGLLTLWAVISVITSAAIAVNDDHIDKFGRHFITIFLFPLWFPLWVLSQAVRRLPEVFQ